MNQSQFSTLTDDTAIARPLLMKAVERIARIRKDYSSMKMKHKLHIYQLAVKA